ncbi:MAG: AraC family transcriptional regulator, partial [Oscillospiraceae bacterium]|nr:AraC family transcriptional regulator [Oscillospiraceae bacterium]
MDWLERMNGAVNYIEENLTGEISYDKAAQIACCSTYHFQRMFSFITEVPLSEYIRRRRLTLAAFELQTSDIKVIDAALKYGYDSPEAFSRAFKILHGVTPASARDMSVTLKAYPKMTFSLSIKGDIEMKYRIEKRKAFEVFGVCAEVSANMEQSFADVREFVTKEAEKGTWENFNDFLGKPHDAWFHAALFGHTATTFKYMLCSYMPPELKIPETYTRLKMREQEWAIFPASEGNNNKIYETWRRIYSEWFPTSGYEQDEAPSFEMWYGYDSDECMNGLIEIWIPVK